MVRHKRLVRVVGRDHEVVEDLEKFLIVDGGQEFIEPWQQLLICK